MMIRKILLVMAAVAAAVYAGDNLALWWKLSRHEQAFQTVRVDHYQAVPLKGGKDEYDYTGSEMVVCVHALFPHGGDKPCWYVERHREARENL